MVDDLEQDFKQIKISRLTLGLIMSVAVTSGVVVWNAAQVAGRISELEDSVNQIQIDMNVIQETDPAILLRLDAMEDALDELNDRGIDAGELGERIDGVEEWLAELVESDRDSGEELRWELDELHHRQWAFEQAIRSRKWGDEILREHLGY
jgi:hypothetical protein